MFVYIVVIYFWVFKFLLVDLCVRESSATCFVERSKEEEKTNHTDHVEDKEYQTEIMFVGF